MGKRDDAVQYLKQGMSPGQIRRKQGVSLETILGYLKYGVGVGAIKRSDVFFSIPADVRNAVLCAQAESKNSRPVRDQLRSIGAVVEDDDIEVVLQYCDAKDRFGDMYENVRSVEVGLHQLIRKALEDDFGPDESDWWRKGVSQAIRKKCVDRREEDDEPVKDPFAYTDLLDLWKIADDQWKIVATDCRTLFPQASGRLKKISNG